METDVVDTDVSSEVCTLNITVGLMRRSDITLRTYIVRMRKKENEPSGVCVW